MIVTTTSLEETHQLAKELIKKWPKLSLGQGAMVVGLCGDLGSGKTTFTQGVAKALGVKENVTSPTFVIEKIYKLKDGQYKHLIHIDAYRLENSDELLHLGWDEIVKNPKNLILIEWADRVEKILPPSSQKIFFKFINNERREIKI